MYFDVNKQDLTLAVVGTGAMGRGIAQIAAQAGLRVLLHDAQAGAAEKARAALADTFAALAAKGKLSRDEAAAAPGRLTVVGDLAALAAAHVVVEAIVENLEAKRELFRRLEEVVSGQCILATNTSSLPVTAIAAACAAPARVAGFHFFNPVPLMRIVEVVEGLLTAPETGEALLALGRRLGHTAVRAKDTPGFIVNHAGRGYVTEALRLLGENVAPFYEIDRILRDTAGFRMGPFELLDLTGLDVSQPVMESIYRQYYEEPRFRPSPLAAQRLAGGLLGRKTGRGFYAYQDNRPLPEPATPAPPDRPAAVWISQGQTDLAAQLAELVTRLGGRLDTGQRPGPPSLCMVLPLGQDATTCCIAEGLDPARTVAIDLLFSGEKRRTLMTTPLTAPAARDAAHGLFAADGAAVSVLRDSAGLVAQRVVACIVNIGCDIAQQGIAAPEDIDRAVTLGLGYPRGPLAMGDALGPRTVLAVLDNLAAFYGDPRYRASPWLRRRALLGVSLLTPDT